MSLSIRRARPGDAGLIFRFTAALSAHEGVSDLVRSSEADFDAALFGPSPRVFCEIAEWDGEPAGIALWYYTFSTILGRHGLYLEDLFVQREHRGRHIGRALMARLARRCVEEDLGRFEWSVLDWNRTAISFYEAHGATRTRGAYRYRMTGNSLSQLAAFDRG